MADGKAEGNLPEVIAMVYRHGLGRPARPDEIARWIADIGSGLPLGDFILNVGRSEEAQIRRARTLEAQNTSISLVYESVLGRRPQEEEVCLWAAALDDGLSFPQFVIDVASSDEASKAKHEGQAAPPRPSQPEPPTDAALDECIAITYRRILGREASSEDLKVWRDAILGGLAVPEFLSMIESSDEAKHHRGSMQLGLDQTDGQFALGAGELLYERGLVPAEVEHWKAYLSENGERRAAFVNSAINAHLSSMSSSAAPAPTSHHDVTQCWIMGTDRMVTKADWDRRASALGYSKEQHDDVVGLAPKLGLHSGEYTVSMIASMYKGGRFIRRFLDNICSQTMFDRSELIIIDADSPDGEAAVIAEYQKSHSNIVYKRISHRVGIYDAWNIATTMARGHYLTNTNLDDLRRSDSIQIQADYLDAHIETDVVYQDFYYSFDPDLTFAQVEQFGFQSHLPSITPHNLLTFNSPHNAPMWRRRLHSDFGLFDVGFRSAGDWEFWLRCLSQGVNFGKINSPHVVYFHNPHGISTSVDTPGVKEANLIRRRYSRKLTSKTLLASSAQFGQLLDMAGHSGDLQRPFYEQAQAALLSLGSRVHSEMTERFGNAALQAAGGPI